MARKKKLDTESAQETEAVNESKVGTAVELNSEETELENIEKKNEEKTEVQATEEKPKKKEKKKLSEEELKRVMTDTKETLVPITEYISCSVHLGTKVITPDMRKFVYKRRADGLAVLNTNLIDDKLREASKFFANFAPEDVLIACKREAGWPAIEKFSEVTGIKCFTKKYPAGVITNIRLENFIEPKLVIICDPWVDKNVFYDAKNIGVPVIAICDTNNYAPGVSQIIPSNNKSRKSLGLILYILAREYLKSLGKTDEAKALKLEDFAGKIEPVVNFDNEERAARKKKEEVEVSEAVKEGV
jgi:small subunit ribosomal protein S2